MNAPPPVAIDIDTPGGRLRAELTGPPDGRLVVCLPGLTANLRGFDEIGRRLAAAGFRVAALDLRGRGQSDVTPPGTYGWPAHARDVSAAATALGRERYSVVGWSMGAFVAMQLAALAPGRLDRLVFVDACSPPAPGVLTLIRLAVERLGAVYPSADEYVARMRALPTIERWSEFWERYFRYELVPADGGVRARTSREAVLEDLAYGDAHDPRDLWPALTMPALLLRAARPLVPGGPFLVTAADAGELTRRVPGVEAVEIDANHYGIAAVPEAAEAAARFLAPDPAGGSAP
ncbi:MAG TPA: alpha/beta fold hydrolase [bacterium]|nr:alpha/beta fold hydrolase [bacterium]